MRECATEAEAKDRHEITRRAEDPRKDKATNSANPRAKIPIKRDKTRNRKHRDVIEKLFATQVLQLHS